MTFFNGDNSLEVRRLQRALAYWAEFDPEQGPRIERAVSDINRRIELLTGKPEPLIVPKQHADDVLLEEDR